MTRRDPRHTAMNLYLLRLFFPFPLVTAREQRRDGGKDKEDDGHPNRDGTDRLTERQAGRQTEKDRQTGRGCLW